MIRSDAGRCPISAQCGILGVAKSTCCWMLGHPEAERADPYEKDVERVWRDSGKVHGARKTKHALEHEGVAPSRRRINRIMKGNGMAGSCSKAAYRPHPARPNDDPAPNILAREFAGERIERMLDVFGITRSLSRPGNPYDNAVVESTNRLVKKELIHRNVYTNVEQLRSDVSRYVWWYNHQRLHSTLGYLSPVEFIQQGKTLQKQSNTPLPIHHSAQSEQSRSSQLWHHLEQSSHRSDSQCSQ